MPIPPIHVATISPVLNISLPRCVFDYAGGLNTEDAWIDNARRVAEASKELLMPKALTRVRTWPGCGTGTGQEGSILNLAVRPGLWRTAACIVRAVEAAIFPF